MVFRLVSVAPIFLVYLQYDKNKVAGLQILTFVP